MAVTALGVATAATPPPEPPATPSANQVVRVFVLDTASPTDATQLLATLGIDAVTTVHELGAVVARAPADRMAVAAELLHALDRPRAEVTVGIELFLLGAESRALLDAGGGELRQRLDESQRARLRDVAPRLVEPQVSLLDRGVGEIHLKQDLALVVHPGIAADASLGLSLRLRPQVEAEGDALTLGFGVMVWDLGGEAEKAAVADLAGSRRATGTDRDRIRERLRASLRPLQGQVAVSSHAFESSVRLRSGETWLVRGLLTPGEAPSVLATLLFGSTVTAADEIVLALTPRIVRGRGFPTPDVDRLCAHGEALRDLCWSLDD